MSPRIVPGVWVRRWWWCPFFKKLVGCRRFGRYLIIPDPDTQLKLWEDITDDDRCQRGPTGEPLRKLTPFVPYQTLKEWAGEKQ